MKNNILILILLLLLNGFPIIFGQLSESFWEKRNSINQNENKRAFGGRLKIASYERLVNGILMKYKRKEMDEAFVDPQKILPARNFLEARADIEQSEVFKIIRKMPKGAVLHAHSTAIVSDDWLYNNVTYRHNLYVCDKSDTLMLHFFENPTNDCNWQLLSKLRNNETEAAIINTRIREQLTMITANAAAAYPTGNAAWNKFESIFDFIGPLISYRPVYEDYFYQALKELYEDNILYLELRTGLHKLYELNGDTNNALEVMRIYRDVTQRFTAEHTDFIGIKLIFAPHKIALAEDQLHKINLTIDIMNKYPDIFAGLDLVGQEDPSQAIIKHVPMISHLMNKVKFFFHAGETNWYGMSSDQNILDAILLNTTRIGHGFAIVKHPRVMELARIKNIAIEVCPISNQVLGLVKDLRNHPANILFASNYPVVISNDDPALWGSKGLSYDFYETFMGMMSRESDIKALKQLALNSISYSSMDDNQKINAYAIWFQKWNQFTKEIKNTYRSQLMNFT